MGFSIRSINKLIFRATESQIDAADILVSYKNNKPLSETINTVPLPHRLDIKVLLPSKRRYLLNNNEEDKVLALHVCFTYYISALLT